jgi:hypothetical protein
MSVAGAVGMNDLDIAVPGTRQKISVAERD